MQHYTCQNCQLELSGIVERCPSCHSRQLTATTRSDAMPEACATFIVDAEACFALTKTWLSQQDLVPDDLAEVAQMRDFSPIYLPYWLITVNVRGQFTAVAMLRHEKEFSEASGRPFRRDFKGRLAEIGRVLAIPAGHHQHFGRDVYAGLRSPHATDSCDAGIYLSPNATEADIDQRFAQRLEKALDDWTEHIARDKLEGRGDEWIGLGGRQFSELTQERVAQSLVADALYLGHYRYQEKEYGVVVQGKSVLGDFPYDPVKVQRRIREYWLDIALRIAPGVVALLGYLVVVIGAPTAAESGAGGAVAAVLLFGGVWGTIFGIVRSLPVYRKIQQLQAQTKPTLER